MVERPFEETEIFEVIKDFNGDKLPGPDGFPMSFFQSCWEILKPDLIAMFLYFFAKGQFEKNLECKPSLLSFQKNCYSKSRTFALLDMLGGL